MLENLGLFFITIAVLAGVIGVAGVITLLICERHLYKKKNRPRK
jgi:hypothetical protein